MRTRAFRYTRSVFILGMLSNMLFGTFGVPIQLFAIGLVIAMAVVRRLGHLIHEMIDIKEPPMPQTEAGRRRTAVHEAGHAVVGWVLPGADRPYRATVVITHDALGEVRDKPRSSDSASRDDALDMVAAWLGGLAAERECMGAAASGCDEDLAQATALAQRMVCQMGFSEKPI